MAMTPSERELEKVQSIFNGKPDVLTAIVKHRTHQRGHLGYLYITRMTLDTVTVAIHPPPNHDEQDVQLKIDPPLTNGREARERLYEWQAKAYEHFDVPECPAITYFSPPPPFPYALPLLAALCVQLFALLGQGFYADAFRSKIAEWGGRGLLPASAVLSGTIHLLIYPIYLFVKLPQHRVPFVASVKWILTAMLVGIGGLNELWDCIEYEKIRHIYSRTDVGRLPPRITSGAPKAKVS